MNSLYLWINICTLAFPLAFSFGTKTAFYKNWKFLLPASFITAAFFIVWDQWFTQMDIWGFNAKYIIGYYFYELPFEEVMFYFTVPYASVFIYEILKGTMKTSELFEDLYRWFTLFFFGAAITLLFWYSDKLYTAITCIILSFILGTHLIVIRRRYMSWLYLSFIISAVPMLVVNGLLTAKKIIFYNPGEMIGLKIGTIPVENLIYNLIMISLCIGLFEWLKRLDHRSRLRPRKQSS